MARRNDHNRNELKALILEASWDIVSKEGFEGLTARKIAQRIGYAPGTIYNVYDSMDALYLHLNAKTIDLLLVALKNSSTHTNEEKAIDNMKSMAVAYMEFASRYKSHWLMLFNINVSEASENTGWYHEKVEELFIPLENHLNDYYEQNDLKNRKMAARVLWSSVHGLCFLQQTGKLSIVSEENQIVKTVHYLIENFVAGLIANENS